MAVTTISMEYLQEWLQGQPENTVDTPYELNVTGINSENYRELRNILDYYGYNKYVDLRNTVMPNVTDFSYIYHDCSFMVYAPDIPSTVTDMEYAFHNCQNLKHSPDLPNGVLNMDYTYDTEGILDYVPIFPSSVTIAHGYEYYLWGCNLSDLDDWLASPFCRTGEIYDSPARIKVLDVTANNCTGIKTALRNNSSIYVDLSETVLPAGTPMVQLFSYCTNLLYAPAVPSGTTSMLETFLGCTNLVVSPEIPSTVTNLESTFYQCSALIDSPIIPASVTNMANTFGGCSYLRYAPIISDNVTDITICFKNCISLLYKPLIPITATGQNVFDGVTQTKLGGSASQVATFISNTTSEFEVMEVEEYPQGNSYQLTDNVYYGVSNAHLDSWLSEHDVVTKPNAYKIKVLFLDSSASIPQALRNNSTKFVDLSYTTYQSGMTSFYETYKDCISLIKPPVLPDTLETMYLSFWNCSNMEECPEIPSGVTELWGTFQGCSSIVSAPVIPNGVTEMRQTFLGCTSLVNPPVIPNSVTSCYRTFGSCTSLVTAPVIPNSVGTIAYMFSFCSNLKTVLNVPSSVSDARDCFYNCSALEKIEKFGISKNTLRTSEYVNDMFKGCDSLVQVGYKYEESEEWHVAHIKIFDDNGSSFVSGKVYDRSKQSVTIPQTEITKDNLTLPVKTDELWFPPSNMSDTEVDELIEDVIDNRYTYWNKDVIPPDKRSFVLWADNANNVTSNFLGKASFDALLPIGVTYTQYTGQKSPNELWGSYSTWEVLKYGGAFFRTEGGNALPFNESLEVSSQSGTTMVFTTVHNLDVGSPIYDAVNNECRLVASVTDTTTVELDSAFTHSNLTNVLIGQYDENKSHNHSGWTSNTYKSDGTELKTDTEVTVGRARNVGSGYSRNGFIQIINSTIGSGYGIDHSSSSSSSTTVYDHSHDMQHIHAINEEGGAESRPIDFTYRIWKRIA